MCNSIHKTHHPIPEQGYGWKIFSLHYQGEQLSPLFSSFYEDYHCDNFGNTHYDCESYTGDGFCIFLTKKEAKRAQLSLPQRIMARSIVKKIEYHGGICRQQEREFISKKRFQIALVKVFRPVDGWTHHE